MVEIILHADIHPDAALGLKEALAMDVEKYGSRVRVVRVRDLSDPRAVRQMTFDEIKNTGEKG